MATIIVGTDLSDNARRAAQWAFDLAPSYRDRPQQVELLVARVIEDDEMQLRTVIAGHSERREQLDLEEEIGDWLEDIDTEGVDYEVEIHVGRKARTLAELADEHAADWLVVGKSGKGRIKRLFVGSTAEHLALRPPCSLALVHPEVADPDEPLTVVSAVDMSDSSIRAVSLGADLVRSQGGELHVLHVIALPHGTAALAEGPHIHPTTLDTHIRDSKNWARDQLEAKLQNQRVVLDDIAAQIDIRPGYPIHEVLDFIEKHNADVLTLGAHGRSRFTELMLGGVGRSLLKKAPCSVILAPPGEDD